MLQLEKNVQNKFSSYPEELSYIKKTKEEPVMKKQKLKDKLDESLGMKDGKESSKVQSMKDRRAESKGMKKVTKKK